MNFDDTFRLASETCAKMPTLGDVVQAALNSVAAPPRYEDRLATALLWERIIVAEAIRRTTESVASTERSVRGLWEKWGEKTADKRRKKAKGE